MEKSLNLDIAGAVSELETLLKKVLPKNIMFKLLLGKGLEFDGYRDFNQSDDAVLIDWKASVRQQKPLVRKYIEERDLKFLFLIDVSDNMIFGSTAKLKCEYSAELAAAVSHLIVTTGDRFGFVLYNNQIIKIRPPETGTRAFEIFVHELSTPSNYGGISNLSRVIEPLIKTMPSDIAIIFIISDFVRLDESYKMNLELLSGLYETIAIVVRDPLDMKFPEINKEVVIEDPETREKLLINPKIAKELYERNASEQFDKIKDIFRDLNIDFLELCTDMSFSTEFAAFLEERTKGGRVVKSQNVY
jgi:uncharacterized protein (DUF58 family)